MSIPSLCMFDILLNIHNSPWLFHLSYLPRNALLYHKPFHKMRNLCIFQCCKFFYFSAVVRDSQVISSVNSNLFWID
jgi:hypothetical protein